MVSEDVGRHITQLARRVCELSSDVGDPAPLLEILVLLAERNTAHSKVSIKSMQFESSSIQYSL